MGFPTIRPRRLRRSPSIRALVRETTLAPNDFVLPLFFRDGIDARVAISTMPGVFQLPIAEAGAEAARLVERGIRSCILFGVPKTKDAEGRTGLDPNGPVPRAIAAMKAKAPDLVVMADVCVDEYTDHGHCGVIVDKNGVKEVDNDRTLEILAEMSVVFARAGADVIAPSDMMDGRVARIRAALDGASFTDTAILSYAVKYASSFYGPFREAADCAPKFGDRTTYQMDPANVREGLREAALDEAEGADMLMVKPALSYLDVIAKVRAQTTLPLGAYNVSGEFSMLEAAAARGMIDRDRAILEVLTSIRRAGADFILTYHAERAAELLGG